MMNTDKQKDKEPTVFNYAEKLKADTQSKLLEARWWRLEKDNRWISQGSNDVFFSKSSNNKLTDCEDSEHKKRWNSQVSADKKWKAMKKIRKIEWDIMGNEVKKLKCKLRKNSDRSKERGSTVDSADRQKFNWSSPSHEDGIFTSITKNNQVVIQNYQLIPNNFVKQNSANAVITQWGEPIIINLETQCHPTKMSKQRDFST